jgi:rhodanese-related sulfurtransferase
MDGLRVTAEKAKALADAGKAVFLDVRSPDAFRTADEQIPGSYHLNVGEVAGRVHDPGPDKEIIAYCTSPEEALSAYAAQALRDQGIRSAHALLGGFYAWKDLGFPVVRKTPVRRIMRPHPEKRAAREESR